MGIHPFLLSTLSALASLRMSNPLKKTEKKTYTSPWDPHQPAICCVHLRAGGNPQDNQPKTFSTLRASFWSFWSQWLWSCTWHFWGDSLSSCVSFPGELCRIHAAGASLSCERAGVCLLRSHLQQVERVGRKHNQYGGKIRTGENHSHDEESTFALYASEMTISNICWI